MNYQGYVRTNYFRVKDIEAFKNWCEEWNLTVEENEGKVTCYNGDGEGLIARFDEETDEQRDMVRELSCHLAEGEVAEVREVGSEGVRYLTGWTAAVNSRGDTIRIDIDNIYDKVREQWRVEMTEAVY